MLETGATEPPYFRTFSLAVRPARVAVLIPDVKDWIHFAHRMMEHFSRTWGGAGDILIPCKPTGHVPEPFWYLLKSYDADYFGLYSPTQRDRQLAEPAKFSSWCDAQAKKMQKQGFHDPKAYLESDHFLDQTIWQWSPHDDVTAELLRDLSPSRHIEDLHYLPFAADQANGWDMADMTALPLRTPTAFTVFDTSDVDPYLSLMHTSVTGALAPSYKVWLEERGHRITSHPVTEKYIDPILKVALHGRTDPQQLAEQFPLYKTKFACDWRCRFNAQWMRQPYVIVMGDTLADFCLGLMLNRMTGAAAWLPTKFFTGNDQQGEKVRLKIAQELHFELRRNQQQTPPLLTSLSIDKIDLEKVIQDMSHIIFGPSPKNSEELARVAKVDEIPIPPPLQLVHNNLCNVPSYSPFVGKEMVVSLDTPIPQDCVAQNGAAVTWWVDLSFGDYLLPTRSCLDNLIIAEPQRRLVGARCSRIGFTYFSHSMFSWGGARPHEAVERPRFRCPDAKEVFDKLLMRENLTARLSSAGQFTLGTLDLFGGLEELAHVLTDDSTSALLKMFFSKDKSSEDTGMYLKPTRRWFLPFSVIKKTTRLASVLARNMIDDWLDRGILTRGLILQCPFCSFKGWYPLEEIGANFRCERCRQRTAINLKAWRKPIDEPLWYYELAEVVYQALVQNAHAPVLALEQIRKDSKVFLFTPELEIRSSKGFKVEIDLWTVADGEIVLGEANTTGRLEKAAHEEERKLRSLRRVADVVTADRIVFATTADNWNPETCKRIAGAFKGARAQVSYSEGLGTPSSE